MRTAPTDLYASLGLTPGATPAQIRHAYRSLLRQHHPDTRTVETAQGDDTADLALHEVLTAYEVLRDPARRAAYDRLRSVTSGSAKPVVVRAHRTTATHDPPIQAGPVRWHR